MASTTETDLTAHQGQANSSKRVEQSLRERDEFFKETYRFFDGLSKHRGAVIAAAVLLVAACIAGGLVLNHRANQAEKGRDALYRAEKAYDTELKALSGVKPPTAEDPASDGDSEESKDAAADDSAKGAKDSKDSKVAKEDAKTKAKAKEELRKAQREEQAAASKKMEELSFAKLDVDAKFPDAVKKYNDVITQYDGSRAAFEARLSLGSLYYNHGQAAKAAPILQAATSLAPGNFERSVAFESWAYALENDGKYAEAAAAFEKALNYAEGSIKGDAWLGIARAQEAMHDVAKARSTYDQIINQLPNSDAAHAAESLKARLQ